MVNQLQSNEEKKQEEKKDIHNLYIVTNRKP